MNVEAGAQWTAPGGGQRSYAVTLDEADLERLPEVLEHLPKLNKAAELLVVSYVFSEGGISEETYRARVKQIKDGNGAATTDS